MEQVIKLALVCVFVFFLINYAPLFSFFRQKFFVYLDVEGGTKTKYGWICRKTRYLFSCIFCVSFWLTLIICPSQILFVPVVATIINNLFLNSFNRKN